MKPKQNKTIRKVINQMEKEKIKRNLTQKDFSDFWNSCDELTKDLNKGLIDKGLETEEEMVTNYVWLNIK